LYHRFYAPSRLVEEFSPNVLEISYSYEGIEMVFYAAAMVLAATEGTSTTTEMIRLLAPGIVAALTSFGIVYLNRKFSKTDKTEDSRIATYKTDLDQMAKQREFIIKENEELWNALKLELEMCRAEREKLDGSLDSLKKRLAKVESEITAWELGLKVPVGFKLVKLTDEDKS
jgi:uncharacterized protein HemX